MSEAKPEWLQRRHAMKPERQKRTVYRDSIDGRFITKRLAQQRPATTQKQTVRVKPSTYNR